MPEADPEAGAAATDAEDIRLMALAGQGDTTAFEDLVERHQAMILGTVGRMLGTTSDVEDIAQQVFIRVWRNAPRYQPRAKFTTWLLKITRNLVFNEMRRRKRHATVPLQPNPEEDELPIADTSTATPEHALLDREMQQAVETAIAALPEAQRLALVLRRYEELSYEEIAEVLETSVPSVKSLLFRARTELRSRLGRYLGEN